MDLQEWDEGNGKAELLRPGWRLDETKAGREKKRSLEKGGLALVRWER